MKIIIKTKSLVILLLLGLLLAFTNSSLAWRDLSEHKTNLFRLNGSKYNVVLVEDFIEADDWTLNSPITKKISVRNGQDLDDNENTDFGDLYVRVQFKEFLGLASQTIVESDERYLIDEQGSFIKFINLKDAQDYVDSLQQPKELKIESVKAYTDDQEYYYIESNERDQYGQYGKVLVMDVTSDFQKSLVTGQVDMSQSAALDHQNHVNGEDNYVVHQWDATETGFSRKSVFTEYISWELGTHVETIDTWDGSSGPKWILDTRDGEAYAYWSQPLEHCSESSIESQTENILESVSLIKELDGFAQYYIHVNLDAVSKNDLKLWTDAPESVMNGYLKD